jgi:hypothetical protein
MQIFFFKQEKVSKMSFFAVFSSKNLILKKRGTRTVQRYDGKKILKYGQAQKLKMATESKMATIFFSKMIILKKKICIL